MYKTNLLNYAPIISDRYNLHENQRKTILAELYHILFIFLLQLTKCLEENLRLGQGS